MNEYPHHHAGRLDFVPRLAADSGGRGLGECVTVSPHLGMGASNAEWAVEQPDPESRYPDLALEVDHRQQETAGPLDENRVSQSWERQISYGPESGVGLSPGL